MIKVKKILVGIGCAVVFLAYFGLSLSCASTPKVSGSEKESGSEVTISLPKTENDWDAYDIELVSENPSPSRILKLISKETEDKKVFYAISEPGNTKVLKKVTNNGSSTLIEMDENLVTSSELEGKYLISEEDAKSKIKQDLEKYFLSEKVRKYVLATGTKNFYSRPKTDLEVARPLLTTMHKMHRAGVDNYVTTDGRLRKLTPRECFRLMGFSDNFIIPVSDTSAYQQAGNSIVVDVLINILNKIFESYP